MSGAEVKSVVDADSVLAREFLIRCMKVAEKTGIIRFPDFAHDFDHGLLVHAKGAKGFSIQWVSFSFDLP